MYPTLPSAISARSGILQLAAVAVLVTYLFFTTDWRFWIVVELAGALAFSGSLLVVYAIVTRHLPFRTYVETWLPMPPIQLVIFLVLWGAGLALAENGSSLTGFVLITAGYGTFSAQSILKVVKKLTR